MSDISKKLTSDIFYYEKFLVFNSHNWLAARTFSSSGSFAISLARKNQQRRTRAAAKTFANRHGKKVRITRNKFFEQTVEPGRNNELLRTVLGLLLKTPTGFDVSYIYGGESAVDGVAANVIKVQQSGDNSNQLYLDKSTNLPAMMSYQCPNMLVLKINRGENGDSTNFVKGDEKSETSQCQMRFADYRGVDGLQLPHRWTISRNGEIEETVSIDSYKINSPDVEERIKSMPEDKGVKVLIRKSKKEQ